MKLFKAMKRIIVVLIIIYSWISMLAQDGNMSVGYVQTELQKNAVNFAVDYAKKLEPKLELFKPGNRSLLSFTPDVKILVGSNDAFDGITAKYVGNIMYFDTTSIAGINGIPDLSKTFHNFPISAGFETNQDFSFVNGLIEAGYIPWYQNNKKVNSIIRQTKVGIFLQGGYKFSVNDTLKNLGGAADESKEKTDENLFRAKFIFSFSPVIYFDKEKQFGFSLIGNSMTWYDFINNKVYYKIEGKLRLMITKDYAIDLGYEKGSGAPNFNEGEQFTSNLIIRF
jgi:hypothetical protein